MNLSLGSTTYIPLNEYKFTTCRTDLSYIPKIKNIKEDIIYTVSKDKKWLNNNYVNLIGKWNERHFSYIMTLNILNDKSIYVDLKKRGALGDFLIIYAEFEYDSLDDQQRIINHLYKSFNLI